MDQRIGNLLLVLMITVCAQATDGDRDFMMCGTWLHSGHSLTVDVDLKSGCERIDVSANASTLSIRGSITAQCVRSEVLPLTTSQGNSSSFCVFWEPLLDQLMVKLDGKNFTLCSAHGLQTLCCTHLSPGHQKFSSQYGIENGSLHGDLLSSKVMADYGFNGERIDCKEFFCNRAAQKSRGANMLEEAVMSSGEVGSVYLPCVQSTVIEMKEDFGGTNVILPVADGASRETIPSIYLPACLKPEESKTSKVVCSYYNNSMFFQKSSYRILEDVISISVENKIIINLPEPIRITFHHPGLMKSERTKCVSWDTRKDNEVTWRETGCTTRHLNAIETECCCNHLTYFAILVDMDPQRSVRHLEALTLITAVCCAVSIVSCAILFIWLCRQRRSKNQSSLVHRGLVMALFFLLVLFVFAGTVANTVPESVCRFFGGLLHYALLSVLCWMAVEVVQTFWMLYMVFTPSPKTWIWYLLGFGVPAVPVIILGSIGNVYGKKTVKSDETEYRMCWMTDSSSALIAHYIINTGLLLMVVSSGLVMLLLVFRKIRHRNEWRTNCMTFLSIWGLSCLFGSTWAVIFIPSGTSETSLFLFCIINSLQGFFLMLRVFALDWVQRNSQSSSDVSSTGSTRQNMLQSQEKN
ncbi:adhesion G-protein coupled receptor G5-like isoform X2 [Neoarius graeffei]|nr:adhesion G-protein coupled receptor G5-like isoform X2 [Neoarius graeffei]XP_060796729.1 adhesion G-protein coupled receptor G5-like isoform X2 [Neoarius graeffei]